MAVRNLDGPALKKLNCQDKSLICLNQRTISCHNSHKPPRAMLPGELWGSKQLLKATSDWKMHWLKFQFPAA